VDGFVREVPAFPALRRPQLLGSFGAGGAFAGQGRAAGDHDLFDLAGVEVGAAELDRADAPAAGLGEHLDGAGGQRCGHPLGAGGAFGHAASPSIGACQVADQPHRQQSWVMADTPSSV
jgi:hypothetical protein